MILQRRDGGLLAITQPDHARLAGALAAAWRGPQGWRPEPWEPVLVATNRHDDGWEDWEAAPSLDGRGRPLDFLTLPTDERVEIYQAGIRAVAADDLHAGLLVSMHLTGLLLGGFEPGRPRAIDALEGPARGAAEAFVAEQLAWQAEAHHRLEANRVLQAQYRLVRLFDRLSLALCLEPLASLRPQRLELVPLGPTGLLGAVDLRAAGAGRVVLDPFPLNADSVVASIPGRWLPRETFEDDDDYRRALSESRAEVLAFTLSRRPATPPPGAALRA